jgi:hypothetical protein
VEEANFEALEAAIARVKKFWCKWYHNITAEKLTCKVYNTCLFDTAEKAKAHETLCAAKKNLVAKLTCDVCKSCSFGTFEDAEAHEKQCYVSLS